MYVPDQLSKDETEVGGASERVLVGIGSLGDQQLVGLIDAGCQARLQNKNKSIKTS